MGDENLGVHKAIARVLKQLRATSAQMLRGYIKALGSKGADVRKAAVEELGRSGDASVVEPLLERLGDENFGVHEAAAKALKKRGATEAQLIAGNIKALASKSLDVHASSMGALRKLGATREQVLSGYIKALGSKNADVRKSVVEELGKLGEVSAVKSLLDRMGDENLGVHQAAARVLKQLRATSDQMLRGYIKALGSKGAEVRKAAVEELGKLEVSAVKSLLDRMGDENLGVHQAAARS